MENKKSFLETWKEVIYKLKEEGLITQEEIDNGFEIDMDSLWCSGLSRTSTICALKNLYEKEFTKDKRTLREFFKEAHLRYLEEMEKPILDISTRTGSIFVTDEKMQSEQSRKNITSKEVVDAIYESKKRAKVKDLLVNFKIHKGMAYDIVDKLFPDMQYEMEVYAIPHFLSEMAENYGERYIQKAQEEQKKEEGLQIIDGGFIEPSSDSVSRGIGDGNKNPKNDRVSEIYSFEQRDEILRKINPEKIIRFSSQDPNTGKIIKGSYTCYIYINPQGNEGYTVISEPLEGDKETRAFYITDKEVESFCGDETDLDKFWKEFVRLYVEMSRTEFHNEEHTYTFKHTANLESYKQKLEAVMMGVEKNPQSKENQKASRNATRASMELYGKTEYIEMIKGVTLEKSAEARKNVFGDKNRTEEKGVVKNG